jgi:hypothetical protein
MLALDREQVFRGQFAVVNLGPQMLVGGRFDQLHVDSNLVAGALNSALHHIRDTQFLRDLGNLLGGVPVFHNGGSGDDFDRANLRERGQEVVVDAVGEELVFLAVAAIGEGQDGNGYPGRCRSGGQLARVVFRCPGRRLLRGLGGGRRVVFLCRLVTREARFPDEITQSDDQHGDDGAVELAGGDVGDGLRAVDLGLALDALRRDFVGPGEEHHHRETQRQQQHDGLHDPTGCTDVLQHEVGDLGQQPAGNDIANRHTEDVSALELFENVQGPLTGRPPVPSRLSQSHSPANVARVISRTPSSSVSAYIAIGA